MAIEIQYMYKYLKVFELHCRCYLLSRSVDWLFRLAFGVVSLPIIPIPAVIRLLAIHLLHVGRRNKLTKHVMPLFFLLAAIISRSGYSKVFVLHKEKSIVWKNVADQHFRIRGIANLSTMATPIRKIFLWND